MFCQFRGFFKNRIEVALKSWSRSKSNTEEEREVYIRKPYSAFASEKTLTWECHFKCPCRCHLTEWTSTGAFPVDGMKLHYLISVILLIYVKEKVCMEQGTAEIRKIQNQVCDPYLFFFSVVLPSVPGILSLFLQCCLQTHNALLWYKSYSCSRNSRHERHGLEERKHCLAVALKNRVLTRSGGRCILCH